MDEAKLKQFFNLNLPKLDALQSESLDVPITQEEVKAAITSMKPGKSPGADGLPSEFYKNYVDILAPILTEVYTEAFEAEVLPSTFMEALITLIPKKG